MSTPPADRNRTRRRWIIGGIVVGTVALYGVLGGLVLPYFARTAAAERLGERLGRGVAIDALSVNPYTLAVTVKGLRILEADGKATFASFDRLDLDGSITSVRHLAPVFDQVTLDGLKVNLVRETDARYNLTDIVGRLAQAQGTAPPPKGKTEFSLNNIRVTNARVDFEDRPKGARHQATDIEVAIPFISNLPTHLKEYVRPSFASKVNGTAVTLTGETLPFENSLRTHVSIDLDALDVARYVEYAPAPLPVKVDAGKLDARLSVRFVQAAGKEPSVDVSGKLALRDLRLSSPGEGQLANVGRVEAEIAAFDPLGGLLHAGALRVADVRANQDQWRIASADAKDIRVDIGKKDVRIGALATSDATFALKRGRDGSIELPIRVGPAAESSSPAWTLAVAKATVDGYSATLADASVKPVTTHKLSIAHLEASDVSTAKGSKGTLSAKLGFGKSGTVDLESAFSIDPPALDARIDARRIDLVPMRPYVEHFATVALKSGNASAKGRLVVKGEGGARRIAYSGAAEIAAFATLDTLSREDLLNWDSIRTTGIDVQWSSGEPLQLGVANVAVSKAYSRLVVLPDGKINLQQLLAATPADPNAPAPAPQPEKAQARNVRIDRVTFVDSRLNFTDNYIKPNYTADVGGLGGAVTNLSSDPATRAEVDLKGSFDKGSPVVITGTVNPLSGNLFVDLAAQGKDIELPTLTAYSQRYAGYGITKGKLTLDVKYHVEDGKMQGRNKIFIEQLTFGDKVEGPEATKLPVLFAVNLLKNAKGEISLELPVSGSLDDPQFDIGGLISQVVVNLFKKAVTAPFTLLAAAFGGSADGKNGAGGGEELAYVDFEPGRAEIGPGGQTKLDSLSKALLDRPAIKLEMAGHADKEKDLQALKRAALQGKVVAARQRALGKPAGSTDDTTVSAEEYPRYLKAAFEAEKIPRPASKDEKPRELSVAEMEALLLERIVVGDQDLGALAKLRSEQVKRYLVAKGQLPEERVTIAAAPDSLGASRVAFKLL